MTVRQLINTLEKLPKRALVEVCEDGGLRIVHPKSRKQLGSILSRVYWHVHHDVMLVEEKKKFMKNMVEYLKRADLRLRLFQPIPRS